MRVSGNDDVEPRCRGIKLKLFQVVQHVDYPTANHDELGVRVLICPRACIYVSANGGGRSKLSQSVNDFWSADVAGVDDVIGSCELPDRFGAQKTVRVGDYADPHQTPVVRV